MTQRLNNSTTFWAADKGQHTFNIRVPKAKVICRAAGTNDGSSNKVKTNDVTTKCSCLYLATKYAPFNFSSKVQEGKSELFLTFGNTRAKFGIGLKHGFFR